MCVMRETLSVGLVVTSGYREGKKERWQMKRKIVDPG